MEQKPVLEVKNLGISFSQYTKGLKRHELKVIANLDLDVYAGKITAIVGSSGSGKSLLAHAVLGILPDNAVTTGEIRYNGRMLTQSDKEKLRGTEIALIPQSVTYLDPLQQVGQQVAISVSAKKQKGGIVSRLFRKYSLGPDIQNYYPFQLSGGMARKVLLATALAADVKVIVADEPTPGLDEEALGEVLKDFRELADSGCAILMITHDIQAALKIADSIAIFYAGTTVEVANASDFDADGAKLRHPYTKALNRALPHHEFSALAGSQPLLSELPDGCIFSDRCPQLHDRCRSEQPGFHEIRGGKVRCFYAT